MKNVLEVLKQKESELALIRRQVECLRFVAPLLDEPAKDLIPDLKAAISNPEGAPRP